MSPSTLRFSLCVYFALILVLDALSSWRGIFGGGLLLSFISVDKISEDTPCGVRKSLVEYTAGEQQEELV